MLSLHKEFPIATAAYNDMVDTDEISAVIRAEVRNCIFWSSEFRGIMAIQTIWYEISPYLYAVIGLAVILSRGNSLGVLCGTALVAAAAIILTLRWTYRQKKDLMPGKRRRA
jgi:hypothetical protein